ncbi:ComEC/Rec2 family competence protein [Dysosmobacter sp.]|uniref:ComEC/Rec2 family competence protein n=1 Tax=Dysosmobacter sp. TaxID=2591382 RepID=UPI002A932B71|nr:hypothetical protein [Dysosmobacter sp.]MDY5613584.1 hypothetical protein [Dysosmobacter sp.]
MEHMKLTFVNVGYGEAILLECPDPRFADGVFVAVIDGGSSEAEEFSDHFTGRLPLAEYLHNYGPGHIDLMVSTHIHEDHICGLLSAARDFVPGALWQTLPEEIASRMHPLDASLAQNDSQDKFLRALNDYQSLRSLLEQHGNPVLTLRAGNTFELCQGLTCQVLAPSPSKAVELESRCRDLFGETESDEFLKKLSALDSRMNNYSLILLLDYQGTRILLPGDTNRLGYEDVDPTYLKSDLFKVGHHGQKDGASEELMAAIRPRAVVCCASSDRRYNSAHPDMLRMIAERGAALYFSDCPQLPGLDLPPHHALTFTVGAAGVLSAQYIV